MKKKPAIKNSNNNKNNNPLRVYDFDETDDFVEKSAQKDLNKFKYIINIKNVAKNKAKKYSPVDKYYFLKVFANGDKSKPDQVINDKVVVKIDDDIPDQVIYDKVVVKSDDDIPDQVINDKVVLKIDDHISKEDLSCSDKFVSCGSWKRVPATCTKSEPVFINLVDDDIDSSVSTEIARNEGKLEERALEDHTNRCATDVEVIVLPDYIIFQNISAQKCRIIFSSSSIKVECTGVCGYEGSFSIEHTVDDIIGIESQWCEQFSTAAVNLLFKLGDKELAEDAGSSRGIGELRFAVFDPRWHEQQEAIKLLNTGYKTKWVIVFDIDARSKDDFLEKNNIFISKNNSPNLSLKEVVYPREDPDAVSINMRDIELLQPEKFVNDTIIDFYLKYLENKIQPEDKHRFHFFNCFFFRKLANLDRDPSGAGDGRAAFQRVRKWTRKVNLFEKDYIFIPVNFSLHWSLIVICHPGDAAKFENEDEQKLPSVPCILHMDSIKGSHRGLKNLFQSYLLEEWKERGNQSSEDVSSKFLNLQFVPLELPQQENSFDCGIFLLHYVELFLKHAPVSFNPCRKINFPNFLNKDWFPPAEASLKRGHLKDLIQQIAKDQCEETPSAFCDKDENLSSEVFILEKKDNGVKLPVETSSSSETESCHINYLSSVSDQETETEQVKGIPCRGGVKCLKEQDSWGSSVFYESYRSFGKMKLHDRLENVMTPIEEADETLEQHAKLQGSSSAMEVKKNLVGDLFGLNSPETSDMSKSPSTANSELETCIIEDSEEEEDGVIVVTDQNKSLFGLRKIRSASKEEGGSSDCNGLAHALPPKKKWRLKM